MYVLNKKKITAWIIMLCMTIPMLVPMFAYAQTGEGVIFADGKDYPMTLSPEKTELGTMVSAKDISNAFSLEYMFDDENKAFEIYDEKHGKIVLMHNATSFYSGENIYECSPYFYVRNGEPLVEIGFFCNMFAASYTYDENENKIVINKNKISDDIAKISFNGNVTPLYLEPVETEYGLIVGIEYLAKQFDLAYEYDAKSKKAVLTRETGSKVELTDGATSFKSSYGEFECGAFFNVINDIPMIEIGFFCDLYGMSYEYDSESKTLTFSDDVTMTEKSKDNSLKLFARSSTLSGNIYYPQGAPESGLNIKLILQQTGTRYQMYKGYTYYIGNNYVLDTIDFDEGDTVKSYSYDVYDYYTDLYTTFALYYEETDKKNYGYINKNGAISAMSTSPLDYYKYNLSAKHFGYSSAQTADLVIGKNYLSGNIKLAENLLAEAGGIEVDLILQKRTKTYTNMYGAGSYYVIGNNHTIGTVTIPEGNNGVNYKLDVSDYFTNAYTYPYYSLFYRADDEAPAITFGYYNVLGNVTNISSIPSSGNCYYTSAKAFTFLTQNTANLTLPIKESYIPQAQTVKTPVSNVANGYIENGTMVTLSTQTDGADIYYTTDGSTPTTSSYKYTDNLVIKKDTVIKAIAVKSGMTDSNVATFEYLVDNNDFIKLVVGEEYALINGKVIMMDIAPIAVEGKVYVPIRCIAEAMGCSVTWNSSTQQVTFDYGSGYLTLTVNDGNCYIIDGRTLVNSNLVLQELSGDDYIVESTPISVTVVKKSDISDYTFVETQTTKQEIGSFYLLSVETNTTVNNMKIAVAGYDSKGKMLCIGYVDESTMQVIFNKNTNITYFKTFVLKDGTKPLSKAEKTPN